MRGRSHHNQPHTKQTVKSLLAKNDLRDLSNQSFVFNELHHEPCLCVTFTPSGEELVVGGHSGKVKVFNLKARFVSVFPTVFTLFTAPGAVS